MFSVVDTDGSGSIDASELGIIMTKLSGKEPQPAELEQVRKRIDRKRAVPEQHRAQTEAPQKHSPAANEI